MITAALLDNSQVIITIMAVVLVGTVIWYFATGLSALLKNIIVVVILGSLVGSAFLSNTVKKALTPAHTTKGDIQKIGGSVFTLRIHAGRDQNGNTIPVSPAALDQAVSTLTKRLQAIGIKDRFIEPQGPDKIYLELPGISQEQASRVRSALEQTARLELKLVHPDSRALANQVAADPDNEIIPGYKLYVLEDIDDDGKATQENILLKLRTSLDGSYILHAQELYGPHEGKLTVELSAAGGKKMTALSSKMRHGVDRLAIILDGKVLSAPVVQSTLGSRFEISGMKDATEAKHIAVALLNPLRHPLTIVEERSISPELATESSNNP